MAGTFETKREAIDRAREYAALMKRSHTVWYLRSGSRNLCWLVMDTLKPTDAWQQMFTVTPDGTATLDIGD